MSSSSSTSINIPKSSSLLHASSFITGAGAIIFHRSTKRLVLVRDERESEIAYGYFLPKGRKDVGESLEECACREGFEETGYPNHLLPIPVPTRAPKKSLLKDYLSTEPIYMHNYALPRRRNWPEGGLYTYLWYVCEVTDEDVAIVEAKKKKKEKKEKIEELQEDLGLSRKSLLEEVKAAEEEGKVFMDYHELRYKADLFGYEEAKRLIGEGDGAGVFGPIVEMAVEMVEGLERYEEHMRREEEEKKRSEEGGS